MSGMRTVRRMGFSVLGCLTALVAGCAGPRPVERVEVPPPTPIGQEAPRNPPDATDERATQLWLEQEVARQRRAEARTEAPREVARREPTAAAPTNEEATSAWLDRTIEARRAANPDVPPEPMYQTIERTVYVDRPVYYRSSYDDYRSGYGYGYRSSYYDDCGQPRYAPYYYGSYRHRSTFPVNTVLGAGVGAIIGHQSHHRDRGAAIGAGIGLLLDLAR